MSAMEEFLFYCNDIFCEIQMTMNRILRKARLKTNVSLKCMLNNPLRTFARKTSAIQTFSYFGCSQIMSYLCQKCKKIGGHRLRFQNKARGKLPQF